MEGMWVALGSITVTLVGAGIAAWIKFRKTNFDLSEAAKKSEVDGLWALIARLEANATGAAADLVKCRQECREEADELRKSIDQLLRESADCRRDYAVAVDRIRAMEDAMTEKGIRFRPWNEPGMGVFRPVPGPDKKEGGGS